MMLSPSKEFGKLAALIVVVPALQACGVFGGDRSIIPPFQAQGGETEQSSPASASYQAGPGDSLLLRSKRSGTLHGTFQVDETGAIRFANGRRVMVLGKSIKEVERALNKQAPAQAPFAVTVVDAAPILVMGEVNASGSHPHEEGMTLERALQAAGGLTYKGDAARVFVTPRGGAESLVLLDEARPITPGTVIRVPEAYF